MIVLLGYMGSGKSAVSQCLESMTGKKAIDLDDLIEKTESSTITQIFDEKGAIYFRKREREALELALNDSSIAILSLGGGTPCYYNNMELITNRPDLNSFYLQASVLELAMRLAPQISKRPMLAALNDRNELMEFIGKHLFERAVFYTQAQHTIKTDGKSPEQIAATIIAQLF